MKIPISVILRKLNLNLDSLDNRINFQKSFYLLKEMRAITERMFFSYYIFGPYSSSLARTGFELKEENIDKEISVSDDFEEKISKLQNIISEGENEPKWIELLGTLHYIRFHKKIYDKNEAFRELINHQSYFNEPLILDRAWKIISSTFA